MASQADSGDHISPPAPLPRQDHPFPSRKGWLAALAASIDHQRVLDQVRDEGDWSVRFAFLLAMSAGITILGLLASSPTIVIGAMLLSPFMGPTIGLGFALATLDWAQARKSLLVLGTGVVIAIIVPALVVLVSPLRDVTAEILARTRPTLFDLLVAVFAALAAAYAAIRGRGGAIVGVIIAIVLMPPLAVVGFGSATGNWVIAAGAAGLFLTNFMAIVLLATLVARFYGFGSQLSPHQSRQQIWGLVLLFLALALPLAWSLRQIAWESWATRAARAAITQEFGSSSRIGTLEPEFDADPLSIRATVFTEHYRSNAARRLRQILSQTLNRPVSIELSQIAVNRPEGRQELDRARAVVDREAAAIAARRDISEKLEIATGSPDERVLVDPVAKRATVQATLDRPLQDWMMTEQRISADYPDWTIRIIPPVRPLPPLGLSSNGTQPDLQSIEAQLWAIERWGANGALVHARTVTGERPAASRARAEAIAEIIRQSGMAVEVAPLEPIDRQLEREMGLVIARSVWLRPVGMPAPSPAEPASEVDEPAIAQG